LLESEDTSVPKQKQHKVVSSQDPSSTYALSEPFASLRSTITSII
jgi:hypothetical protein